jgi:hypothetical protein
MPLWPTKGGLSVRFTTLDQIFFKDVNTHNRRIYRIVPRMTGDIARGGKALAAFFSVIANPACSPENAITK